MGQLKGSCRPTGHSYGAAHTGAARGLQEVSQELTVFLVCVFGGVCGCVCQRQKQPTRAKLLSAAVNDSGVL